MIATLNSVATIVEVDLRFISANVIHSLRSFKSFSHLIVTIADLLFFNDGSDQKETSLHVKGFVHFFL